MYTVYIKDKGVLKMTKRPRKFKIKILFLKHYVKIIDPK